MQKFQIVYALVTVSLALTASSCQQGSEPNKEPALNKEVALNKEPDLNEEVALNDNGQKLVMAKIPLREQFSAEGSKGKGEAFTNEDLPQSYVKRKFIKGEAGRSYDIFLIPGNVVKYDPSDSNYVIVTVRPVLKEKVKPKMDVIEDGILYSNKINKQASFNASALIGQLNVSADQLLELIIQDVTKSVADNDDIDYPYLKKIIAKIPVANRVNYYFVKTATLTLVNSRKYSKAELSTKVNASYITAEGKAYSSKEKFSRNRLVSVDLISLADAIDGDSVSTK